MPLSDRPGSTRAEPVRAAQCGQRLGEPGPGHGLAPVGIGFAAALAVAGDAGAREQPHRFAERQPLAGGAPLDRLELLERAAQPLAVDLDPLAADEGQPVGLRQQLLDLGRATASRRRASPPCWKSSSASRPSCDGALAADGRLHLRARRPVHAPARRHAHDHAGALRASATSFRNCSACCGVQRSG